MHDKTLVTMGLMRILSGCLEISAAFLMWHFGSVATALRINGLLGLSGPTFLLMVSAIGLPSLASSLPPSRLFLIGTGVLLIILGTR